ncbi:MAG: hypothetical protein P0119_08870 [Nitrospira sp.]|nr:hypothetical protein [Nitrospira sp.]
MAHASSPIDPKLSVFINCPYDAEFAPLFDAIVFATVCCGFVPRSALESGSVAEPRMERITRAICASKYSIHDLSRCKGEGTEQLARFNMPLELGIAIARRYTAIDEAQKHDWLLLVPQGHQYAKFVSDLAGFDPKFHNGTVDMIVTRVMSWLKTRPDAVDTPDPREVLAALPNFAQKKDALAKTWIDDIPWADILLAAKECVPI